MARIPQMAFALLLAIPWAGAPDAVLSAEFSAEAKALPFPPDAEKLQFTAWSGDIEFVSPSSFKAVAAFYLDEMASRGWELDASEVEVDDDSVDLVFRSGKLAVDMRISQWSKETRVRMDCEGLDFVDAENPTKLAEAGVPVPRAVLFFHRETPLPDGVAEVMHRGDGVMVYGAQAVEQAFSYYTGIVKRKGFRETRRPIITDSRRYAEFKKGAVEVSVNVFSHEDGSRSVLVYEELQAPRIALLPTPATLDLRNGDESAETPDAGFPGDLADESGPVAAPIDASTNQGQAVAKHGEKTYTFSHVACFQTKDRGDYATMLVFSTEPIPYNKLQNKLATEDDPSFHELYGDFETPEYFSLQLGKYLSFNFSVNGVAIGGHGMEQYVDNLKIKGTRMNGTFEMSPEEILSKEFSFKAAVDAAVMSPMTRISNGVDPPIERSVGAMLAQADLPWPQGARYVSNFIAICRHVYDATISKPISEVEAFYRQELPKVGWSLKKAESGVLHFANDEKDAFVTLTRESDRTAIKLVVRYVALARSEGLLPDPGKGRLVLANAYSSPVTFTIGKTDYRLKIGQGADSLQSALNYSVTPGRYSVIVKIPGRQPKTERLDVGKDETWGIIALPTGGYMPMQMY